MGRKSRFTAVVVVNNPCCGWCVCVNNVIVVSTVANGFAQVVIECEVASGYIRNIGRDIVFRNFDLTVLHILGMDKLNAVQYVQVF